MATYIANLKTIRDNACAALAAMSADWVAAGMPPTYAINGQNVDWNSWYTQQMTFIQQLNDQVGAAEPFEIQTQALS